MTRVLNITNGDSAVSLMRAGGVPGDFLPWRDVLHDGPVPGDLDLERLSALRARFIAERGWGNRRDIDAAFRERDKLLEASIHRERVVLWFEHDL